MELEDRRVPFFIRLKSFLIIYGAVFVVRPLLLVAGRGAGILAVCLVGLLAGALAGTLLGAIIATVAQDSHPVHRESLLTFSGTLGSVIGVSGGLYAGLLALLVQCRRQTIVVCALSGLMLGALLPPLTGFAAFQHAGMGLSSLIVGLFGWMGGMGIGFLAAVAQVRLDQTR
ncbi:putative membrane protein of unknown function [Magnetospira sp. QH-2]|nr:putative membrane protein of unknown function [Magnetospira sp. QH-2]